MANYKEIVTKAVIGKGKKTFTSTNTIKPDVNPTTILGCWVINHVLVGGDNHYLNYKKGDFIDF